jgi:hypothetical protein
MAGVRFTDLQSRPMEFLDFTSLTLDEFQQLVPPFETAFHARMAAWQMDGNRGPRAGLPSTTTARSRHRKTGSCLSWSPSKPTHSKWSTGAYAEWCRAKPISGSTCSCPRCWRRALGDAPARSLTALAQRLGVSEADTATMVAPLAEEAVPVVAVPAAAPASPLVPMMGRNDALSAPQTLLNRPTVRAARKKTIREKMSCWSTPCSLSSF